MKKWQKWHKKCQGKSMKLKIWMSNRTKWHIHIGKCTVENVVHCVLEKKWWLKWSRDVNGQRKHYSIGNYRTYVDKLEINKFIESTMRTRYVYEMFRVLRRLWLDVLTLYAKINRNSNKLNWRQQKIKKDIQSHKRT